ncbi:hypothetical protein ACYSNW_01320 [Enterococcus sp. LJL99]
MIEGGWTISDVETADYFYLLHLFTETTSKEDERMSAEAFFQSIGQSTK